MWCSIWTSWTKYWCGLSTTRIFVKGDGAAPVGQTGFGQCVPIRLGTTGLCTYLEHFCRVWDGEGGRGSAVPSAPVWRSENNLQVPVLSFRPVGPGA